MSDIKCSVCFMKEDDLTDEMIKLYFPMLTQKRQNEISLMATADERRIALCTEVMARKSLSELCGEAPDRVSFLRTPEGNFFCDNKDRHLYVGSVGGCVVSAAVSVAAGLGTERVRPFAFADAQQQLSDFEIRSVVASSGYSLMDIVNGGLCSVRSATELYAGLIALKKAANACLPVKEKKPLSKLSFSFSGGSFTPSDKNFDIIYCGINKKTGIAAAVVARRNNE